MPGKVPGPGSKVWALREVYACFSGPWSKGGDKPSEVETEWLIGIQPLRVGRHFWHLFKETPRHENELLFWLTWRGGNFSFFCRSVRGGPEAFESEEKHSICWALQRHVSSGACDLLNVLEAFQAKWQENRAKVHGMLKTTASALPSQ